MKYFLHLFLTIFLITTSFALGQECKFNTNINEDYYPDLTYSSSSNFSTLGSLFDNSNSTATNIGGTNVTGAKITINLGKKIYTNATFNIPISETLRGSGTSTYIINAYNGDNNSVFQTTITNPTLTGLTSSGNLNFTITSAQATEFDKIEITINKSSTATNIISLYNIEVISSCEPIKNCNELIPLIQNYYGSNLIIESSSLVNNTSNLIDSNINNSATMSVSSALGVPSTGQLTLKNNSLFSQGSYIGFNLSDNNILSLGSDIIIKIETYIDNTLQESYTIPNEIALLNLINTSYRQIGFETTKSFNKVKLSITNQSLVSVFSTNIYNAIILEPCDSIMPLICNDFTKLNRANQPVYVVSERTGITGTINALVNFTNPEAVVNNNSEDYLEMSIPVSVATQGRISVRNLNEVYTAGHFAGFYIENTNILNLDLLNNFIITTYKNGQVKETVTGDGLLLNLNLLGGNNKATVGFITKEDFDEIQFSTASTLSINLGNIKIYNAVVKKFCGIDSADWDTTFSCNTYTNITNPTHAVYIDNQNTKSTSLGLAGINVGTLGSITNVENVIDSDTDNYASISRLGLGTQTTIAIKNAIDIYPASVATPYFVGFEISTANVAEIELANNVKIVTFLNGVEQESSNIGNTTLLGATVVETWKKGTIGFVATMPFDEIRYQASSLLNAELGETRIHNLVIKRFCENIDLSCTDPNTANKYITVNNSNFPLRAYASIDGLAQVDLISGSQVQNISNLIDDDQSTFVRISPTISIPTIITIGVEKLISNFPENTYAEFEIKKSSLVNLNLLSNYSVKLYDINNNEVQTISSNNLLVGLGLFQLGGNETQKIGFKSDVPFNRAELIINKLADVDLGVLDIYGFNVMKTCPTTIDCNFNEPITTANRPVIINSLRTGVFGVACVGCNVTNPGNVIDEDLTNSSNLSFTAGLAANTSLSVKDLANVYPKGTSVGFTLTDMNPLLNLDLISGIRVKTFLNNVEQEEFGGESLLNINLLFIKINPDDYVIGFKTSKRFDEVQISVGSVASLLNVISVSNLVINTSTANDTDPGSNLVCYEGCTKPGDFTINGQPTNVGITTLQSKRPDWPYDIPNGFIALESKNKGFVLNRTTSDITKITQPVEGMIIYDTTAQCVKLFNGQHWKCITKDCND